MATYKVGLEGDVMTIGFSDPGSNDVIVKDAAAALAVLDLKGGPILKITGPASLPVAMVIAHAVGHKFGAVACFDPKLGKFVVCIAHGSAFKLGDLV
jgi:CRISPR-associated protein Csx3